MPATADSDAIPKGVGYLHVPAKNAQGFLPVQTFYAPYLCTAVVNERDLVKAARYKSKTYNLTVSLSTKTPVPLHDMQSIARIPTKTSSYMTF